MKRRHQSNIFPTFTVLHDFIANQFQRQRSGDVVHAPVMLAVYLGCRPGVPERLSQGPRIIPREQHVSDLAKEIQDAENKINGEGNANSNLLS
jgi:hypothetical protein